MEKSMFKKFKRKTTLLILIISLFIMFTAFCAVYIISYADLSQGNREMLELYAENYITIGNPNEQGTRPLNDKTDRDSLQSDHRFDIATFYSVCFLDGTDAACTDSEDTPITEKISDIDPDRIEINNDKNDSMSDEEVVRLASSILESGKDYGTRFFVVYLITTYEGGTLVSMMDNSMFADTIDTVLKSTGIVWLALIVVLIILSRILADRIIRPLEEAYSKQRRFISDAGHELKTPIAAVSANAEILSRELKEAAPEENKWLSNIVYENNRMSAVVSELLNLARLENTLPMAEIDLGRVVAGGALPFEAVAFEAGYKINFDIDHDIAVTGNEEQLSKLTAILVENAIQYTDGSGPIEVSLKKRKSTAILKVSDHGEEIPKDQQKDIFERFTRLDGSRQSGGGNYGLGLTIAKAITDAHMGKISVSCEDGVSTFTVELPA